MQVNHRCLALFADVRAQAGRLPHIREAGNGDVLRSDNIQVAQQDCTHNQCRGHAQEPGERFIPCDGFGVGRSHFHGRCLVRVQQSVTKGIKRIEQRQHDARQKRCLEQRPHRQNRRFPKEGQGIRTARCLRPPFLCVRIKVTRQRAQQNDHDRRWNDLSQRTRGRDHTCRDLGRIVVAQHRRQCQQSHGHNGRTNNAGRRSKEGAHNYDRNRQTAWQRAENAGHGGQQIIGDLGTFQRDAHQNEHQNRQQRFDRLTGQHAFVHTVHDERDVPVQRHFPTRGEDRFFNAGQIGVSEKRYGVGLDAGIHQIAIGSRSCINRLVDQQTRAVHRRDDPEGNDTRPANGKSHRKAGKNTAEQADEYDDQADFDPVQPEKHQCVPS